MHHQRMEEDDISDRPRHLDELVASFGGLKVGKPVGIIVRVFRGRWDERAIHSEQSFGMRCEILRDDLQSIWRNNGPASVRFDVREYWDDQERLFRRIQEVDLENTSQKIRMFGRQ